MANQISLNSGVRSTLLSLQRTSNSIDSTQFKLSTGRKVNGPLDDASAYFSAKNLDNRAADLSSRKDGIVQGIKTLETAINGLESIESTLKQMKSLAEQGIAETDATARGKLATQYDALRTQLDGLATDSSYQGVNLIKGTPDNLKVKFNEDGTQSLTVTGVGSDSAGLSVTAAANSWAATSDSTADLALIDDAITTVRGTTKTLGTNSALLSIRADFTDNLVNTLKAGAGELVNADLNEESANMLALQTRQQLGTTALSMASQAEQAVLRLF